MKACGNSQNGMRRIIKGNSSTSSGCMATTYILRCADNKLYVGSTTNIKERIKRHNAGYASEFTHLHRPVELVYKEDYDTYQEAFKRERQLKKWTTAKKEALIAGDIERLKELSKSKGPS